MKLEEKKIIKHKKRSVPVPVCPDCDESLLGNNSIASPYYCSKCDSYWLTEGWFSEPNLFKKVNSAEYERTNTHK